MKRLLLTLIELVESAVNMTFMVILIMLFVSMSVFSELKSSIHFTDKIRRRVVRRTSHTIRKSMRERFHP